MVKGLLDYLAAFMFGEYKRSRKIDETPEFFFTYPLEFHLFINITFSETLIGLYRNELGIIEVSLASKNYESFSYIFEEIGRFVDSELHISIPEFAKKPLKESLKNIKKITPELASKADKLIQNFN